ncbi:MAG: hypothetical protein OXO48_10950 [Caldilineaceae bacterium]|nr:hypothetical protein [Caldilineaceae bacterium]
MRRRLYYLIGIVLVALTFGAVQVDAQGALTLESVANRLNRTNARVSTIETAIAPTPTNTPKPTRMPRPTLQPTATPEPNSLLRVGVSNLFREYSMYKGMTIEVSGQVEKKNNDRVELYVPGWFSYFVCRLSPDEKNLPLVLKNRQSVILRGNSIYKESNTVYLRNCSFVSPTPVELTHMYGTRVATTATAQSVKATATIRAQKTRRSEQATKESARSTRSAVTATARAAATKRAEVTPTATPQTSETHYRKEVARILTGDGLGYDVASSIARIGDAFTRAGRNPSLILNDQWRIEVVLSTESLKMSYNDAKKLKPPISLRNFHNLMIEGLSYCNLATGKITKGIDNLDADLIEEAANLIELCGAMVGQAGADPNW